MENKEPKFWKILKTPHTSNLEVDIFGDQYAIDATGNVLTIRRHRFCVVEIYHRDTADGVFKLFKTL